MQNWSKASIYGFVKHDTPAKKGKPLKKYFLCSEKISRVFRFIYTQIVLQVMKLFVYFLFFHYINLALWLILKRLKNIRNTNFRIQLLKVPLLSLKKLINGSSCLRHLWAQESSCPPKSYLLILYRLREHSNHPLKKTTQPKINH